MRLHDLLSRCDTEVFQEILGRSCVRLMGLLNTGFSTATALREVVVGSMGEASLLINRDYRAKLLEILRPSEAEALCTVLGVNSHGEPYTALQALNIPRGSPRESAFFSFFETPVPQVEVATAVASVTAIKSERPLFAHQRRAAREIAREMSRPPYRVLLHMPTGSGKTRTAMSIVADFLRATEPALVIWVAYSEELCDQAFSEFEKTWASLGDREVKARRFWGKHELETADLEDGVIVAGLPKLIQRANDLTFVNRLSSQCKLLIVDEAHQAVAPHYKTVLSALLVQSQTTPLLGLTATPGRTWNNVQADQELSELFARKKVTLKVDGYTNPVDYLVHEGYLARADFKPLFFQGGNKVSDADVARIKRSLDIPEDVLESLASDEARNLAILTRIEQLCLRHKRILVFASSVSHAHLLAAVLIAKGRKASAVTTRTSTQARARAIEDFKSNSPDTIIICNYGVLTTGFDAPQTSCAVIARPTNSLVLYSQMVGRAIRGPKAGGNLTAEIVTVIDGCLPGFGGVSEAFSNWEDIWD